MAASSCLLTETRIPIPGTPPEKCSSAAYGGQLECLRYAHENGCRWGIGTTGRALSNDHLECLRYARDNGCPCGQSLYDGW